MSCKTCDCVIGTNYDMSGGHCSDCRTTHGHFVGTYLGKEFDVHVFRVRNYFCPGCGKGAKNLSFNVQTRMELM